MSDTYNTGSKFVTRITPLLQARRKADPSFIYAKDKKSGQYHLQNQLICTFPPEASLDDIREAMEFYVYIANEELKKRGSKLEIALEDIRIRNRVVIVIGRNINQLILLGGGIFNPPPPPPPYRTSAINIEYDRILVVVAFQNDFDTFHTVLPESLLYGLV